MSVQAVRVLVRKAVFNRRVLVYTAILVCILVERKLPTSGVLRVFKDRHEPQSVVVEM